MPDPESAPPPVLVSACLLGVACNHTGAANASPAVLALADGRRVIPVCPETVGGLPTPRPAAEVRPDGSVHTRAGADVTAAYVRGAAAAVAIARAAGVTMAILKARSPSCGSDTVYDGTFTRTLVERAGVTAAALRDAGVEVISDEDLDKMPRDGLVGPGR